MVFTKFTEFLFRKQSFGIFLTNFGIAVPLSIPSILPVRQFFQGIHFKAGETKICCDFSVQEVHAFAFEGIAFEGGREVGGIKVPALFIEPGAEAHQLAIGGRDGFAGDIIAEHGGAAADMRVEFMGEDDLVLGTLCEQFERAP